MIPLQVSDWSFHSKMQNCRSSTYSCEMDKKGGFLRETRMMIPKKIEINLGLLLSKS